MTALSAITQKVFALNVASSDGTSEFGSTADGSTLYSSNPASLQTSAWLEGWADAVISGSTKRLPVLQDMNSVHYVTSYSIAYLQQEGVGVWLSDKEYRLNSIVKKDGTSQLFISLANSNTGNALTDGTKWQQCGDLQYIPASSALLTSGLGSVTQAYNANLAALAGLTGAANKVPSFTGVGAMSLLTTGTSSGNIPLVGTISATTSLAGLTQYAQSSDINGYTNTTLSLTTAALVGSNYGQMRRIARLTASNSSTLGQAITTCKKYLFVFYSILPSVNGVMLTMQFSTNGGSTILNSSYITANFFFSTSDTVTSAIAGKTSGLSLTGSDSNNQTCPANVAAGGINGDVVIFDPSNTSNNKQASWDLNYYGYTANNYQFLCKGTGRYNGSTTAINYVNFSMKTVGTDTTNGTMVSGYIDVWEFV